MHAHAAIARAGAPFVQPALRDRQHPPGVLGAGAAALRRQAGHGVRVPETLPEAGSRNTVRCAAEASQAVTGTEQEQQPQPPEQFRCAPVLASSLVPAAVHAGHVHSIE